MTAEHTPRGPPVGSGRCRLASHGGPWHHRARDAIPGDHRIRLDALLSVCGVLLPAVMTWLLWGHLRETERNRQSSIEVISI